MESSPLRRVSDSIRSPKKSREVVSLGLVGAPQKRTLGSVRIRPVFVVVLVIVVIAIPIAIATTRSRSPLAMPSTGVVTVTGFGSVGPANPSSHPTSVVLNTVQATVLRNRISEIPSLTLSGTQLLCMENETMFTVTVKARHGDVRSDWVAQARLCPAPGILYVHGTDVGGPKIARYCSAMRLILSYFPKGKVDGTRVALHFCR